MKYTPSHLKTLEEIGREYILGLVEVLRQEGLEAVRYALGDMTRAMCNLLSHHLYRGRDLIVGAEDGRSNSIAYCGGGSTILINALDIWRLHG